MSKEQMINEIFYKKSVKLLKILLQRGIISDDEYIKIDNLNQITFSPQLAEVYA